MLVKIWPLFLVLAACGSDPPIDLEPVRLPQGFDIQSSCYRTEGLGSNIILTVTAFSFPNGCDIQARLFMSQAAALQTYQVDNDKEVLKATMRNALGKMPEYFESLDIKYYGPATEIEGIFDIRQSRVSAATCLHLRFENPTCDQITEGEVRFTLPETGLDIRVLHYDFHAEHSPRLEAAHAYLSAAVTNHIAGP